MQLQAQCRQGYVDPALMRFAVQLVGATREPSRYGLPDLVPYITFGASPRATIGLIEGAKALALLRGRTYVLAQDVVDLVPDVLRHRIVLSFEALSDGLTPDQVIARILQSVPAPDHPLDTHVQISTPT
jgi:MoxR-like ATPase